jgi:hypothetical protein
LSNIEDIAETARIVLDYIEADNHEVSGLVRGFIEKREEIRLEGLTG